MQDLRTASQTRGTRLALAAVAVALFGLLSMHGWGSHAGAHSMGATPQSPDVMMSAGHDGPHAPAGIAGDDSVSAESGSAAADDLPQGPLGDGGGSFLGLCLAVLTGLILGFALLLVRRNIRILRRLVPTWPNPVRYGRDRDPPDLLQLCVIRC
ncbi:DUF6153 family protein [Nocardioides sp. NPDC057772]|uniref:DUF6153 family protein n=1 Tax=Nocardioides sp. NPDC057772 TaxID=3346245 RepID=UPI0036711FF7